MRCNNVGGKDRVMRYVIGAIGIGVALFAPIAIEWKMVILVIGGIALVTALTRYCPVNAALGLNTCRHEERRDTPTG